MRAGTSGSGTAVRKHRSAEPGVGRCALVELVAGLVQVDLLRPEGQRLASGAEGDDFHAEHARVERTGRRRPARSAPGGPGCRSSCGFSEAIRRAHLRVVQQVLASPVMVIRPDSIT
jgi:hypothetical protein